eukprot:scaffold22479_cov63-Phaeocystis_antarctica.AAC.3
MSALSKWQASIVSMSRSPTRHTRSSSSNFFSKASHIVFACLNGSDLGEGEEKKAAFHTRRTSLANDSRRS